MPKPKVTLLAIADFSEAITQRPDIVFAFNGRGVVYTIKGEYDLAIADYNKALALNSTYIYAIVGRGVAYGGKGLFDLAIADFEKALALSPGLDVAKAGLAEATAKRSQQTIRQAP
ncbi:MAG TPA: tetratricopeptide repeat protein [Rhizomicrobium sp.]|jgi:lipoprotein NlpI|nr:tetratricopeptide repeat protein [Rhizomicrobium sp.]